jgi:hypothetical protein
MTTTTNVAVYNDEAKIAEVIASHQPKTKEFDPLLNTIQTNEVMVKSLTNYIEQIKTNIYIGKKAMYFVARDAFDAKAKLPHEDFVRLVETFGWNASSQSKLLAIGGSNRLFEIYKEGRLPSNWTTLYELAKLTDVEFNKVNKLLEPEVTWGKIAKALGKTNTPDTNWLLNFLNLEIDKSEIESISTFEKIVERVKSALSKIPQVKIDDERIDSVKQRLTAYISKLEKDKEKEEANKLKKLKDNNDKKLSQTLLDKSKQIGKLATA